MGDLVGKNNNSVLSN